MWLSLADKNLIESYKKGFLPDEIPKIVVELLKALTEEPYAKKLSAVTSLGRLYLTTALSWDDRDDNYEIYINQIMDAGKILISMSSNLEVTKKYVVNRRCSLEEAIEYIDLYAMSILLKKHGKL